jgi:lipopolysaccharide assembly outer membrane protein LptD (OstA)
LLRQIYWQYLVTLIFVLPFVAVAQQKPQTGSKDTAMAKVDTSMVDLMSKVTTGSIDRIEGIVYDSVQPVDTLIDASILKSLVNYTAEDSMAIMVEENKAYLYNKAHIDYGDITLEAGYIELDWEKNEVYARGVPDSTGATVQKPIFKQGEDLYETDEIRYNFSSNKAIIKAVITREGEGYLHGSVIKRQDENTLYIKNTAFTTCNKRHPDFEIIAGKAKVIIGDRIVTGPANLVVADVPTPIVLPFGFFPAQDNRASGFIIPVFNAHQGKGYGLVNGGYYFNLSEYYDLSLTGEVFSRGGWGVRGFSNYRKRYAYSGNLEMRYSHTIVGDPRYEGFGDYLNSKDFRIRWTHTQDPKARPDLNFSASVDLANPTFNQFNTTTTNDFLQNTTTSAISLDKRWLGTPLSLTASMNQTQNNNTKDFSISLPKMAFTMQRIMPFANKNRVGSSKWYERIGIAYAAATEARVTSNYDSLSKGVETFSSQLQTGISNNVSIGTNERVLKFFSLNPAINVVSRWYPNRQEFSYRDDGSLKTDTVSGFSMVNTMNASVALSTKAFGTFLFKKGRIKAIRHMVTPSFGLNYSPDYSNPIFNVFQQLVDSTGTTQFYNRFDGYLFGTAGQGVQGNITMGLNNNLEAKVRSDKDSTGERKIKLLERLNINTSYNMAASAFNWAPLNIQAQSSILKNKVQLTYQSIFDFYGYDPVIKKRVNVSAKDVNGVWARNTSSNFSVNTRWSGILGTERKKTESASVLGLEEENPNFLKLDSYMDFSMAWSVSMRYNFQISKPDLTKQISTHALGVNLTLDPTPNWHLVVETGYDLVRQQVTFTTFGIVRDLHCWELRLNWVPFGFQQSYMIGLNIKASSFKDAKLERRRNLGDF